MVDICKGALLELGRTLIAHNKDNLVDVALLTQIITVTAAIGTGIVSGAGLTGYFKIRRLQEPTNANNIYDFVDPETFLSKRYRTSVASSSDTSIDDRFYTIFYNATTGLPEVRIVPIPSAALSLEAFVNISFESIFTLASTSDMPFIDIEDLMLDYVEREACATEHDTAQVQFLNGKINNKLMELGLDIQKTNRQNPR
jgi:hypothetical protein